jgi:hypothetical protein
MGHRRFVTLRATQLGLLETSSKPTSELTHIAPPAQTDRPASILRPGGVIAIVDLIQVDSPSDLGFFAAAQPIYERYGEGHRGPPAPTRDHVDPPIRAVLEADGRFEDVTVRRYDWDQTYSASDGN